MTIHARRLSDWPPLTWCAQVEDGSLDVEVLHGQSVETRDDWCVEGVWAEPFAGGNFDRTSLVFGSGVRDREDHVDFVGPGTNIERLWHLELEGHHVVSNSLPALLAVSGTSLLDEIANYPQRLGAALSFVGTGTMEVPADGTPIRCAYFDNLRWDGRTMETVAKPVDSPPFDSYDTYRDHFFATAHRVVENAHSPERQKPLSLLTTVSSGYDSSAVASAARAAGCQQAVTIESARSAIPRSDSGEEVARHLGLDCSVYPRGGLGEPDEIAFWAAMANTQDANLAVFDYGEDPCLLFTGVFGGHIWTSDVTNISLALKNSDPNGLGFCEYRLRQGVVHVPLPYAGARRGWEIFEISNSQEMTPWVLGGAYDRPIPRRIAEEAGVPRDAFGMKKSATQYEESFLWPYCRELQESYQAYLEDRGHSVPWVEGGRVLNWLERELLFPLRDRLLTATTPAKIFPQSSDLLFQWANHTMARELRQSVH